MTITKQQLKANLLVYHCNLHNQLLEERALVLAHVAAGEAGLVLSEYGSYKPGVVRAVLKLLEKFPAQIEAMGAEDRKVFENGFHAVLTMAFIDENKIAESLDREVVDLYKRKGVGQAALLWGCPTLDGANIWQAVDKVNRILIARTSRRIRLHRKKNRTTIF
jgi:hypothetical protein